MDLIFEHPVFDSAREKVKGALEQLELPQMVGLGPRINKTG